ncbi:MAG TPA: SLBB domain-containing protein [Candidatus Bacteroides merdavium]|uniref:SLBB domain-containing protein n=1 Tax=Candidatus Bacteroides merdavium TaxID=2838472 RepID=A0A9D2GXK8_9BACE|nr:SLBB domain-containing protein [Candidatus Bacteroides merdavium]
MRRLFTLFFLLLLFCGAAMAQQMSDEQVVQYVKDAQKTGKSEREITVELMRRGVTKEQVERIKEKYENAQNGQQVDEQASETRSRQRGKQSASTDKRDVQQRQKQPIQGLRSTFSDRQQQSEFLEDSLGVDERDLYWEKKEDPTQQIFGHNIFSNPNLTFEPNYNIATPVDYRLGPGDEVIIDVWGASETTIRQTISPEGSILVNTLGPVYLSGKTVGEANQYLKQEFARIYSGVSGTAPTTDVKLTLGEIRSIQVNVMGEVMIPGTYTLSSFSSVFHALYSAGGVNKIGSLRHIKIVRNGDVVAELDVYDLLMKGKMKDDIRLQDGDVVLVDPYISLVQILGKVKRPMFYELTKEENMKTLLEYAGGFTGDAYKKAVRVVRKTGRELQIYNVDEANFASFRMDDGDVVTVDSVLNRYENRVEIRGAVYRPGLYQLDGSVNTVKNLLAKAEGVRGDAFLNRAILDREKPDLTHEMIQVDIRGLLNGTVADIPLVKNDILYIPSIHDIQEEQTVTIHGEVANPGTFLYSENLTIEDLVLQAGGLLEAASTTKVEIARRVKSPKSEDFTLTVGENFSFDLKDGMLVGDGSDDFRLKPFDEVYIRRSPAYYEQRNVTVAGEVLFSGSYALSKKNERLSDLVEKAGGVTPAAYVRGARLMRTMTEDELRRKEDAMRMVNMGDSISMKKLDLSNRYSVGIDLEKALENPGSEYDMVLREGDILYVPEYVSTVKINGAVMYPNTVLFKKGENLRYYINQAGGFGNGAKKRRAYVVYMNGTVSRLKSRSSKAIEPGCEIIVPAKDPKKKMSAAEIIGMGTSAASLATMVATLVNLFK